MSPSRSAGSRDKWALGAALLALGAGVPARAQFCPCYSVSAQPNNSRCAIEAVPGVNPDLPEWQTIFTRVGHGPAAWGAAGPAVAEIGQGCDRPEPLHQVAPVFPCELLEGIAMQETGWRQFCVPTQPSNMKGPPERTIISFDCGYGVGQVTTGMHLGENPAWDRDLVAADATYNLATGAKILSDKWRATNCVGDNQPRVIEDWYLATWAYNGLSWVNSPNNPNYDAKRPVCDPNVSCAGRPYQEKVWGWMEHPPSPEHYPPLAPAYPNRGELPDVSGVKIPALSEPTCAGPTDCTASRGVHRSACLEDPPDGGAAPAPDLGEEAGLDAGELPPAEGGCACGVASERKDGRAGALASALGLGLALALRRRRRA